MAIDILENKDVLVLFLDALDITNYTTRREFVDLCLGFRKGIDPTQTKFHLQATKEALAFFDEKFTYMHPDLYKTITNQVDRVYGSSEQRWQEVELLARKMQSTLTAIGLKTGDFFITGRAKSYLSFFRKFLRHNFLETDEVFDSVGIRIVASDANMALLIKDMILAKFSIMEPKRFNWKDQVHQPVRIHGDLNNPDGESYSGININIHLGEDVSTSNPNKIGEIQIVTLESEHNLLFPKTKPGQVPAILHKSR